MALSASVGNLLRLSSAGGNPRRALDQRELQRVESTHHGCAAVPSTSVLNSSGSCRLVTASRLRWRQQGRGQERLVVRASGNDNSSSNQKGETGTTSSETDVEALEARLGVGRRARRQQAESSNSQGSKSGAPAKPKQPAKAWDSMNLAEKAWSVYIDPEKGVLFWLNKLAYGAIFAIIGGWIVFRFIGPALGWYQLDQPLLSPDRLLDGGS